MVGDPLIERFTLRRRGGRGESLHEVRIRVIYEEMMQIKRGEIKPWAPPPPPKRGLWFWRDNGQEQRT